MLKKKQKSLVSVYDNSNDGEQQLQAIRSLSLPLVGILGRNQRTEAFRKRLLLSGFPEPILCDVATTDPNPNEKITYVSHDMFYQSSPAVILLTDNRCTHFEHLLHQQRDYLIIDVREIVYDYFSRESSPSVTPVAGLSRAFGNLSDWEIEHGTQRVAVAVEQTSPLNVVQFIHQLQCFPRGIYFVDQYSYGNDQIKSFRHCLFPMLSTIIVFSLCTILSIMEYSYHSQFIYRQASSISAATSLTLLAILLLIRPKLELLEFFYSLIGKKQKTKRECRWNRSVHLLIWVYLENPLSRRVFIQRWLQSRRYLAWYSLAFGFLHLVFLIFTKTDRNVLSPVWGVMLGMISLILLFVLSFVFFPWISERLLWREYRLLTSYLGPSCLLIGFIHVFIHWQHGYAVREHKCFNLKFFSMILPLLVLILRFIMYGLISPSRKLVRWIQQRQVKKPSSSVPEKDPSLLLS